MVDVPHGGDSRARRAFLSQVDAFIEQVPGIHGSFVGTPTAETWLDARRLEYAHSQLSAADREAIADEWARLSELAAAMNEHTGPWHDWQERLHATLAPGGTDHEPGRPMADLSEALQRLLASASTPEPATGPSAGPLATASPSPGDDFARRIRRYRWALASVSCFALAMLLVAGLATWKPHGERAAAERAMPGWKVQVKGMGDLHGRIVPQITDGTFVQFVHRDVSLQLTVEDDTLIIHVGMSEEGQSAGD
jgi:hypothetical protein